MKPQSNQPNRIEQIAAIIMTHLGIPDYPIKDELHAFAKAVDQFEFRSLGGAQLPDPAIINSLLPNNKTFLNDKSEAARVVVADQVFSSICYNLGIETTPDAVDSLYQHYHQLTPDKASELLDIINNVRSLLARLHTPDLSWSILQGIINQLKHHKHFDVNYTLRYEVTSQIIAHIEELIETIHTSPHLDATTRAQMIDLLAVKAVSVECTWEMKQPATA